MTNEQQKIAARIKALLAKAQSTEHEAEAAAFMAKAQQLLDQYQIDVNSLQDGDDPVRVNLDGLERTEKDPSWQKNLYIALGALYGCHSVINWKIVRGKPGFVIELTGRDSSIITTELMYPWVKERCYAAGRNLAKEYADVSDPLTAAQYTRRVANALTARIYRLVDLQNKGDIPRTEAAQKNALITQDRVLQVFNDHYANDELTDCRASSVKSSRAAEDAAEKIGLHRQATGQSTLQIEGK